MKSESSLKPAALVSQLLAEALIRARDMGLQFESVDSRPTSVESSPQASRQPVATHADDEILAVLDRIGGAATPAQLKTYSSVSRPTLNRALARLRARHLITCSGTTTNRIVRRASQCTAAAA